MRRGPFLCLGAIGKDFWANCRFVPFMAGKGYAIFFAGMGEAWTNT
jgi:hypothetical protein